MASVPTLRRRSELNYKTLHEGDPLPVPQQKRNINVVLPETYIVERLVWRKKNDQVSMIINLLLRFQDYQQTTLVDKHLTKPTHKNFTAKLKKCVNIFHADCFLKILFWKYSFKIVYKFQTIWTMIRLDDSRDLSWVQIYQQTTLENKVLIERPPTNEHLQIKKNADVLHNIVQILLIYFTLFKSLVLCIVLCWIFFSK